MRNARHASLALLPLIVSIVGCVLPGVEPPSYGIRAQNDTRRILTFKWTFEEELRDLPGREVEPGESALILSSMGRPREDDLIFRGGMCTVVDVVAVDQDGKEVARHPPGLCMDETWIVVDPDDSGPPQ